MAKNLVIVESPAKAKTIEKFLGKDFQVESSYGHIADLPAREIGVDVTKGFKPKYEVSPDKKALVKKLKDLSKKAEIVWLASDEDREGEAISWHLAEELKLEPSKTKRIVFHEITKNAILKAIENPRSIDYNLVNAQQARRVLDRLVGYELSPILWKKVKTGLSAGRVQSVSVRLIVEREREIQQFSAQASFHISAEFSNAEGKVIKAKLPKTFASAESALAFLQAHVDATFSVKDLETRPAKKSPAPPFTTSTLQQEAARKLYMPVGITMQVAQRLYEAGYITYMRTDSVNLSQDALQAAKDEITRSYGAEYHHLRSFSNKNKSAQEAHEAIRPTDMRLHQVPLERDQARLYELIWKRTLASQMSDAVLERTTVSIEASSQEEHFVAQGEVIKFEGFLKVYLESSDDEEEEREGMLPAMKIGERLSLTQMLSTERFSRPPARYTEASLVKKLEELGIGRPSTYAPTISTIIQRNYVEKGNSEGEERKYQLSILANKKIETKTQVEKIGSDKGKLIPTDIGIIVNDFLVKNFSSILDYHFTAKVEQDFDEIAEGNKEWTDMLEHFYGHFHTVVTDVAENAERESGERILGTDPKTGKTVSVRLGKYGPMAQLGEADDEEKQFVSLPQDLAISTITLEEVLNLFLLPKKIGTYRDEPIEVNNGRYGPYVKYGASFVSLDKGEDPLEVTLERAIALITAKEKADAPIAVYDGKPVTKGKGRFGPFIKWNDLYINVSKKYDFDQLSTSDVEELIKDKLQKEMDKVVYDWTDKGIKVEKGRWGRFQLIKGKTKIDLPKTINIDKFSVEDAEKLLTEAAPAKTKATKSTAAKKTTKAKTTATKSKTKK